MAELAQNEDRAPLELEIPAAPFVRPPDRRIRVSPPPPVRVVAVEDPILLTIAGLEKELDAFYIELLRLERDGSDPASLVYKAENASLRFDVVERPVERETLRMLGVEVERLRTLERDLIDRGIPYQWQKSIMPGCDAILLMDPAGNWLELRESRGL